MPTFRITIVFFFLIACPILSIGPTFRCSADDEKIVQVMRMAGLPTEGLNELSLIENGWQCQHYLVIPFADNEIDFDRQYDVVDDAFGLDRKGKRRSVSLTQGPSRWKLKRKDESSIYAVIRFRREFECRSAPPTVEIHGGQVNSLEARQAKVTGGDKLQFEPLAYKNTVGYWVNPDEFPTWQFNSSQRARFRVRILQGCGRGQGGSEIELRFGKTILPFTVRETGQFQAFRWYDVGEVELPKGAGTLAIKVKKLAKNAVMDVREIRLEPIAESTAKPIKRPNVVIFFTDDQGTLDMNCYGSRDLHTPNMDAIAYSGVRFTQAYAHIVCCPSRAMLMTGRYPQRCNVNNWTQGNMKKPGRNMDLDELTIAEILKAQGYRTALFGKWHLGAGIESGPTRQGFDHFFGIRGGFIDNFNHHYLHQAGFHDLYSGTTEQSRPGEYFPDLVTRKSIEFISQSSDHPFLLYMPLNIPHYPEQADSVFDQRYSRLAEPRRSYAKVVSTTDERIGQVLRKLDELKIRENTIVILMSDNGHSAEDYQIKVNQHSSGLPKGHNYGANGGGGNTGKWIGNKNTFLEGGIRVPAVISYPKVLPTDEVRRQMITACDWLPTVLELCGIDPPDRKLDGKSLVNVIVKNEESPHSVFHWQWQNRWAVRSGNWKLVSERNQVRLYNLDDPKPERVDHAGKNPQRVRQLTDLHENWLREVSKD